MSGLDMDRLHSPHMRVSTHGMYLSDRHTAMSLRSAEALLVPAGNFGLPVSNNANKLSVVAGGKALPGEDEARHVCMVRQTGRQ
jgi:hypothetical protein